MFLQAQLQRIMNNIELIKPSPEHVPELGRICFEAFRSIHDRHGFVRDFPDLETAVKVIGLMTNSPSVSGVAARADGRLLGSNFLLHADEVGGVGPITVDPNWQGHGLGRTLMKGVMDHAERLGLRHVRLLQDSFNTASLSLYASLGFDVREPIGVLRPPPAAAADPTVRLAREADLPVLAEMSAQQYRVNRGREMADWFSHGFPILIRETGGVIRGYLIPGKLGHGIAETDADALALIGEISRHAPPGMDKFFLPLRQTSLYRDALRSGCRLIKVMTLMTRGPYEKPSRIWMPSILF
jgi:GNAT superfamily N-acetyltransferase